MPRCALWSAEISAAPSSFAPWDAMTKKEATRSRTVSIPRRRPFCCETHMYGEGAHQAESDPLRDSRRRAKRGRPIAGPPLIVTENPLLAGADQFAPAGGDGLEVQLLLAG